MSLLTRIKKLGFFDGLVMFVFMFTLVYFIVNFILARIYPREGITIKIQSSVIKATHSRGASYIQLADSSWVTLIVNAHDLGRGRLEYFEDSVGFGDSLYKEAGKDSLYLIKPSLKKSVWHLPEN